MLKLDKQSEGFKFLHQKTWGCRLLPKRLPPGGAVCCFSTSRLMSYSVERPLGARWEELQEEMMKHGVCVCKKRRKSLPSSIQHLLEQVEDWRMETWHLSSSSCFRQTPHNGSGPVGSALIWIVRPAAPGSGPSLVPEVATGYCWIMADFPSKVNTETSSPHSQSSQQGGSFRGLVSSATSRMDMSFLRSIPAALMLAEMVRSFMLKDLLPDDMWNDFTNWKLIFFSILTELGSHSVTAGLLVQTLTLFKSNLHQ